MDKLIDITQEPIAGLLEDLLFDRTTRKNIIWATETYSDFGDGYLDKDFITARTLLKHTDRIKPRMEKSAEDQQERTRKKAEVFTPSWICNEMNNYLDEDWFGRKDVFNIVQEDHTWIPVEGRIDFPEGKTWKDYVDSRRLEITCGEAPYLISRYDVSTGEFIEQTIYRIGILDRKLRIVNENAENYDEWLKWVYRAFESCYGYEYQGDNLLIARINALLTFTDYYLERWGKDPDQKTMTFLCRVISWNFWQMDGLACTVPMGKLHSDPIFDGAVQGSLFENDLKETHYSRIQNWRRGNSTPFINLKERKVGNKLFDFIVGNPPYNEDFGNSGDNGKFAKPVYNEFMDSAFNLAEKVELIHPARFLFNAGSTPKVWNKKMLNDKHFKILEYTADGSQIFPNTDIKGGIAISYRDSLNEGKPIKVFVPFRELTSIVDKVVPSTSEFLDNIVLGRGVYRISDLALKEHPEIEKIQSKGHKADVGGNAFQKLKDIVFFDKPRDDGNEYVEFVGLQGNKRTRRFAIRDYVKVPDSFYKYNVFVPKANGSGALGEVLSTPLIGQPLIGHTETFLTVGSFDTEEEANNLLLYIKTKFARVLLGVLKVTQDNTAEKWKYVPLQNYSNDSDIDWKASIAEIDQQLYAKYGLDDSEIDFIESHVKEMA
ncbi:Eco57I restriction-modification methylase domain-containing protein [Alloscardovia macacae]|uniref:Restriction endonuclease Eco57I n=1 Tax=Alloscardovia macacae TaxID=1160091 RepID=A0A261F265_9BIFI|nr:Eco57I restriction-modification methylase domain-containing protein [Alloscardovia macacae]OZG53212.1 restriction endonuclease Eco57I [Alloscardovia macacae]